MGGIVLSNYAAKIPLLPEYIEAKTGIPTVWGNPWQLVQASPEQQQALMNVASEFSVAIGLAERTND
jgi:type IV pilus assembly protein PilM/plasmid segregation protein ParM